MIDSIRRERVISRVCINYDSEEYVRNIMKLRIELTLEHEANFIYCKFHGENILQANPPQ